MSTESAAGAKQFWAWFQKNEPALLANDDPESDLMNEFTDRLQQVHSGLVWEISPAGVRPRELVVSADGLAENADAVDCVCDAAPALRNWQIVRFRPRVPDDVFQGMGVRMNGLDLNVELMEAALYPLEDGLIAIDVFAKACKEEDDPDLHNVLFIFLDSALGEFDMMTKVSQVRIRPFAAEPFEGFERIPFAEMRGVFDELFEAMHPG